MEIAAYLVSRIKENATVLELSWTIAFLLSTVTACSNVWDCVSDLLNVLRNKRKTGENGLLLLLSEQLVEQQTLIAIMATMHLFIGCVSVIVPTSPTNPYVAWTGVAFLISGVSLFTLTLRRKLSRLKLFMEIRKYQRGNSAHHQ